MGIKKSLFKRIKNLYICYRLTLYFLDEIDKLNKRLEERGKWRNRKVLRDFYFRYFSSKDHVFFWKFKVDDKGQKVRRLWKRWVWLGLISYDGDLKYRFRRRNSDKNFRKEVEFFHKCIDRYSNRYIRVGYDDWLNVNVNGKFRKRTAYRWWKKKRPKMNMFFMNKEELDCFTAVSKNRGLVHKYFFYKYFEFHFLLLKIDREIANFYKSLSFKINLEFRMRDLGLCVMSYNRMFNTYLLNGRVVKDYKGSNVYFLNRMLYDSILDTDRVRFKDDRFLDDERDRHNSTRKGHGFYYSRYPDAASAGYSMTRCLFDIAMTRRIHRNANRAGHRRTMGRIGDLIKLHNSIIDEDLGGFSTFKLCSSVGGNLIWWNSGGKMFERRMLGNEYDRRVRNIKDLKVYGGRLINNDMNLGNLVSLDRVFRMSRNRRDVVRLFRIGLDYRLSVLSNRFRSSGGFRWINRHERRLLGSEGGRYLGLNIDQYDGFMSYIGDMKKGMDRHESETRGGVFLNRLMVEYKRNQKLEIKGRLIMRRAMRAKTMRFGIHERIQKSNSKSIYVLNEITTYKGCTSVKIMIERQTYAHQLHEYNQKNVMAWLSLISRFTDSFYNRLSNNNDVKRDLLLSEYLSKRQFRVRRRSICNKI